MLGSFPVRLTILSAAALMLAACNKQQDIRDFSSRDLTLPNGTVIQIESLRDPTIMARGAMFRDSLPPGRGLLYEYAQAGNYGFWMYQTTIPLDTIWMDRNHNVVEIVENMQPCPSKSARECPHYGGREKATYVLQLAAGQASKSGIRTGSTLAF